MSPFTTTPYWRLSGFYFFYFASLGVFVPYWGLYLQWQGFSAQEIGELTAIFLGARIVAPNIWGWIADHHGQRMRIVRAASFIGTLVFSAILLNNSYLWIAIVMLIFSLFWNATLPQFEANTLQHLGNKSHHYSKIRLWGSIGFILSVSVLGILFETISIEAMPIALIITMTGIWLMSLTVPESAAQHLKSDHQPLTHLLKQPSVLAFFAICFLTLLSHGPYYTFYTIYLEQHGYGRTLIGQLWALGVIAEIIVFLLMHRWLPRYGIRVVLIISLILSTLRWLLIGFFPDSLALLLFAQILHAASFGSFHAVAITWVHQHFTGKNQARGQALYSSIGFGAGGVLGSLLSGYFWVSPGPTMTFLMAAITTFFATLIALRWLK
ncbi:MAG: MFS transporter [Piscirickettsiaceae bacterium]|jgi:PPP family 3-phenylpropionic acid transporter|nr:MFS transporter [Piscirickettsiaceae bacterium]